VRESAAEVGQVQNDWGKGERHPNLSLYKKGRSGRGGVYRRISQSKALTLSSDTSGRQVKIWEKKKGLVWGLGWGKGKELPLGVPVWQRSNGRASPEKKKVRKTEGRM